MYDAPIQDLMNTPKAEETKFTYRAIFSETFRGTIREAKQKSSEIRELAERVRIGIATDDEVEQFGEMKRNAMKKAAFVTLSILPLALLINFLGV